MKAARHTIVRFLLSPPRLRPLLDNAEGVLTFGPWSGKAPFGKAGRFRYA